MEFENRAKRGFLSTKIRGRGLVTVLDNAGIIYMVTCTESLWG